MAVRAMKAGAVEFLTKPFRHQDLLDAIQQALGQDPTRRAHEAQIAAVLERFESLTSGERRVLPLVVSGRPNKQIAGEIGTSEATVKVHRSQLMKKMGADSLPELVRLAEKIGIPGSRRYKFKALRSQPKNHRFTGLYESKFRRANAQWIWPDLAAVPRCIFAWVALFGNFEIGRKNKCSLDSRAYDAPLKIAEAAEALGLSAAISDSTYEMTAETATP